MDISPINLKLREDVYFIITIGMMKGLNENE